MTYLFEFVLDGDQEEYRLIVLHGNKEPHDKRNLGEALHPFGLSGLIFVDSESLQEFVRRGNIHINLFANTRSLQKAKDLMILCG